MPMFYKDENAVQRSVIAGGVFCNNYKMFRKIEIFSELTRIF